MLQKVLSKQTKELSVFMIQLKVNCKKSVTKEL